MQSQMSRLLRQSPILCCCVVLSMFWLASCSEQSEQAQVPQSEQVQDPRCKQVTGLFAISDWEAFATGPSIETGRGDDYVTTIAKAKSLIAGFGDCNIWRHKSTRSAIVKMFTGGTEEVSYICEAPAPTARSDDLAAATKAVAAEWRSCFAGWQESFRIFRDPNNRDRSTLSFRRNEDAVSFSSTMDYQTVMNGIQITKTMRK